MYNYSWPLTYVDFLEALQWVWTVGVYGEKPPTEFKPMLFKGQFYWDPQKQIIFKTQLFSLKHYSKLVLIKY